MALETELGSVAQEVAVVSDNPFTFTMSQQTHTFVVGTQFPTDNDMILSIQPNAATCPNFRLGLGPSPFPARVCGGSGGAGCPAQFAFPVTYTGASNESCTMDINWSSGPVALGGSGTAKLNLNSAISAPAMSVAPAIIDFGQVTSGTASTANMVTVTNTGTVALLLSGMEAGSNPAVFPVSPVGTATLTSHMLGVGSAEVFRVTCTPPLSIGAITYTASLEVTANTTMGAIMKTSMFTCQGVVSGLTVVPTQVAFPSTLVGRPPPDQTVRISGSATTQLSSIILDAAAINNNVVIQTAPPPGTAIGAGVSITLHYAATQAHDLGPLGKLIIRTPTEAREIAISGEALVGSIGTNPASVDLGAVCVGSTAGIDVEVFANAAGSVTVTRPPQPVAPFAYTSSATFPVQLPGNHLGNAVLHVTAAPTSVGDFSGSLRLPNDIPGISLVTVPLTATGAAGGVAATPELVQFGTIAPNSSTANQAVTLTNCSKANVQVTAALLTGQDAAEFALVGPANPAMTLKPGDHETFLVVMSAHDALGDKSATLRIEHDGVATEVQLEGTVSSGSNNKGTADRETYYGCQVGAGSGGAVPGVLVLATAWSLRRRRRM